MVIGREKFENEKVEELKLRARLEETLPEADACADCERARAASGDSTDLCAAHLRAVYGL